MRKRFFKISIGLLVTFIMSIMPVNIQYIFAAENEMLVDDTVTTGVHYFTYTEETDTSGKMDGHQIRNHQLKVKSMRRHSTGYGIMILKRLQSILIHLPLRGLE